MEVNSDNYTSLGKFISELKLEVLAEVDNLEEVKIFSNDINRAGLQLSGFLDYYDTQRIQVLGNAEVTYIMGVDDVVREQRYHALFEKGAPCFVFCRGLKPDEKFLELAKKYNIPVLSTKAATSHFVSKAIRWLNLELGAVITIHGCLVDIYGTGVFIRGESGIGKSETTLELIRRGHRLIADDAVEIHRASDETLFGKAPTNIKNFIELRGVGIINIERLFGIQAILESQRIDMSITLEEWNKDTQYDRLGLDEHYIEILGNKVANYVIPVRPGRNLAIIFEAAALNFRQKQMGYSAAEDFMSKTYSVVDGKIKR